MNVPFNLIDGNVLTCTRGTLKYVETELRQADTLMPVESSIVPGFNPLRPNSDQHQISPCNINAYSTTEVMGIKDRITQGAFS